MPHDAKPTQMPIRLPKPPSPLSGYVRASGWGEFIMLSGQLPLLEGTILHPGRVGEALTLDEGIAAARQAALNVLAHISDLTAGFASLRRILRVEGYVACSPDFVDHPAVLDGASDVLVEVLGERGHHARVAIGVQSLPRNSAVELVVLFAIDRPGTEPRC